MFHLYTDPLNQLSPPCCYGCGNTLWRKLQHTANSNTNTHTHSVHHMDVDRPLPWPLQRAGHLHSRHTRGHKYTHICSGHQTLLILSQGSQQRRDEWWIKARIRAGARDRWAKASTARWCLFIAKANKSLAWLEPCPGRSESSFYQMLMIVFFFCRWQKKSGIFSATCRGGPHVDWARLKLLL